VEEDPQLVVNCTIDQFTRAAPGFQEKIDNLLVLIQQIGSK
jgi:hypothetical protein